MRPFRAADEFGAEGTVAATVFFALGLDFVSLTFPI
jgi:hypothetical protein